MKLTGRVHKLFAISALLISTGTAQAEIPKVEAVPGEYIVRLKPNAVRMNSGALSKSLGAHVKSSIPSQNIVVVKRPMFETTESAVKSLAVNNLVDVVEPNFIYRANRLPDDPLLGQLWGIKNIGQKDSSGKVGVAGVDVGMEQAWDIATGSIANSNHWIGQWRYMPIPRRERDSNPNLPPY